MHPLVQALAALVPSVGVGLLFWLALRSIIQADRRERIALARLDAQDSVRAGPATSTESP
ncbi:hypothetical protein [Cellulomonas sp. KRMCY2]|uniref:hypothetical protein n=1 Tax=Cellulomonas sp. KRMCY2 TaxID=1304865 RepID=UPI00045E5B7A|nr:hypothetical protein [Cellulomonas sp. KRMCY2]